MKSAKNTLFSQLNEFINDVQNKKDSEGNQLVKMPENFDDIVFIASEDRTGDEKPFWMNYCKVFILHRVRMQKLRKKWKK